LRGLESAGQLHVVKKVGRTTSTRTFHDGQDEKTVEETKKRIDVELYSGQRFLDAIGTDQVGKRPPEKAGGRHTALSRVTMADTEQAEWALFPQQPLAAAVLQLAQSAGAIAALG
jgi:hypothetical protein